MSDILLKNNLGNIIISEEAIAHTAGMAAIECYGIVGMSSRSRLRDSFVELVKKENITRGVEVHAQGNEIVIDLYIIVGYGTKISEVAQNIMEKVKYVIESVIGVSVRNVNINVEGVRVS